MKNVLASEADPSLLKGKSYSKLQIFVQMDGCFNANIASMDSSTNMPNFHNAHHHFLVFFLASLQNISSPRAALRKKHKTKKNKSESYLLKD